MWHAAFRELKPAEGVDLRGKDDGSLLHMRDTYATITAYAPRYVARQLRETRLGVREQAEIASTAKAEAWMAGIRGDAERQARQEEIARQAYAKAAWFRARESEYAVADAVHREYMERTAPKRRLAVAADAEYRARHPEERLEPLRSAEPDAVTDVERAAFWPGGEPDSGRKPEAHPDAGTGPRAWPRNWPPGRPRMTPASRNPSTGQAPVARTSRRSRRSRPGLARTPSVTPRPGRRGCSSWRSIHQSWLR
jgi:hypothetical protein